VLPLAWLAAGCVRNIVDTDLISSNTIFLAPTTANTVFIQNRNSSDNQQVTLSDLSTRPSAKAYQVVPEPNIARFVLLTNVVYCNQTHPDLPVESMVAGGYGSSIGSTIFSGLSSAPSMGGMFGGPMGAVAGGARSSLFGTIGGIFDSGPSRPKLPDDIIYACVADVQVTDKSQAGLSAQPAAPQSGTPLPPGVYQTRLAASIQ
jgi:hypothetical protein